MRDDPYRKHWILGFLTIPLAVDVFADWYFDLSNPYFNEYNYWWEDMVYHWFTGSAIIIFVASPFCLVWFAYFYWKHKNDR